LHKESTKIVKKCSFIPKKWKLLVLIFACLAVIKDIPEIYRTLIIGFLNIVNKYIFSLDELYLFVKNNLLFIYKDSEFWIQVIFIFLIFLYYFIFIIKNK
jgi:hypothetical protein